MLTLDQFSYFLRKEQLCRANYFMFRREKSNGSSNSSLVKIKLDQQNPTGEDESLLGKQTYAGFLELG